MDNVKYVWDLSINDRIFYVRGMDAAAFFKLNTYYENSSNQVDSVIIPFVIVTRLEMDPSGLTTSVSVRAPEMDHTRPFSYPSGYTECLIGRESLAPREILETKGMHIF